jgi:outer membrane lipoprotein-sorting protein
MKTIIYLICFFCLNYTFSQQAKENDPKAQTILDKLSNKMKALKSFQIEFSASIKNQSTGTNQSEIGKGWVKGNKYCATYGDNTVISNGIKSWTVVKEDKAIYQADVNDKETDGINPKKLMTIWETGFKNKYDHEEAFNGEKVHIIQLFPKDPKKVDYHTIIIYIAKDNLELKKAVMKSKDGSVMTYTLSKLVENPEIEDSKFVVDIKKYPGFKIVKN